MNKQSDDKFGDLKIDIMIDIIDIMRYDYLEAAAAVRCINRPARNLWSMP